MKQYLLVETKWHNRDMTLREAFTMSLRTPDSRTAKKSAYDDSCLSEDEWKGIDAVITWIHKIVHT